MKPIKQMSTKELIAEYNERTGKDIKKFSTRAAGERQVEALRRVEFFQKKPVAEKPKPVAAIVRGQLETLSPEPKLRTESGKNSDAVKASWSDPNVAAARMQRHKVSANGQVYKSFDAAVKALGLKPVGSGRLRLVMKRDGAVTVDGVVFTLVNEE